MNKIKETREDVDEDVEPRAAETGGIYYERFIKSIKSINDDLNMPQALAVVWDMVVNGIYFVILVIIERIFSTEYFECDWRKFG